MEFPSQLKAHRERLALSQEDVAQRIYVSRQTISNWETGKTYPDIHSLLLLANLFDVSVDVLLRGDVASMETKVRNDSRTLRHLGWAMLGFMIAMLVAGGVAIILRDAGPMTQYGMGVGCVVALLFAGIFFLCAFAAAVWAEVLKRQNDVVTFREIIAFDKGVPADEARDDSAFGRKHPVASIVAKVCSGAIFGFTAMMVVTIIAKYIRDFVFYGLG